MTRLLLLALFSCLTFVMQSQVTLYDFEAPETSVAFQIFGGNLEGVQTEVIANPNPSGVNTSAMVMEGKKASDAPDWGGMFANPKPAAGINATNGGQVCLDVWMDHMGLISLKLEMATNDDPANYRQEVANTVINAWETLCFDLGANSLDGDMSPATGKQYEQIVIFPDFGTAGTGTEAIYYFDNIIVPEPASTSSEVTLMDFETPGFAFQYFGSILEPELTQTMENPNKSGINVSDSVTHYIKAVDAMTWAGAVVTPEIDPMIDGTATKEICIKVYYAAPGNLTLKLELADFADANNWIQTQDVTAVNEWTNICFDLAIPSFEGNMATPVGFAYPKIVLFPDFGTAGGAVDVNYYIDDIVLTVDNSVPTYDVDFAVDMNGGPSGTVYVNGTFNGWGGFDHPLDDSDGDGIWTGTINMEAGAHQYKFTIDGWSDQEMFDGTEACTTLPATAPNINRMLSATDNVALDTVCWNNCYACGESVNITWNVNMEQQTVSADGVFLAGGAFFGHGDYPMSDPDGDNIYSITINREIGFETFYIFLNGLCLPDWNCKEQLGGLPCGDPGNFNDRWLPAVMADETNDFCFGQCGTDGMCETAATYNVTFNVDVSAVNMGEQVFIAGQSINGWDPTATEMLDADGDNIFTATVALESGAHEYKFINGADWEALTNGDPCTITDMSGMNTNRLLSLGEMDTVLLAVIYGSCDFSTSNEELIYDDNLAKVYPTVSNGEIIVEFNELSENQNIKVYDITGKLNYTSQQSFVNQKRLDLSGLSAGMHIVKVQIDNKVINKKIVIN